MNKKKTAIALIASLTAAAAVAAAAVGSVYAYRVKQLGDYKEAGFVLPEDFTVTAHTGCEKTAENSLEAVRKGIECGADIVEFDLNFTENGEPVLSHNEPKGGEVTLGEAFACLAEYDSVAANVDIKSTKALEKVLPLAEEYGVEERIFFTGVSEDYLGDVKSKAQGINYYLNLEVDASLAADSGYLDTLVAKTKNAGAEGINMNYKGLTAELVKAFHENGLKVSVWTVDGELDMYKALSASPDNITTRSPSKLCEITAESR